MNPAGLSGGMPMPACSPERSDPTRELGKPEKCLSMGRAIRRSKYMHDNCLESEIPESGKVTKDAVAATIQAVS